jgi:hypothetical protein
LLEILTNTKICFTFKNKYAILTIVKKTGGIIMQKQYKDMSLYEKRAYVKKVKAQEDLFKMAVTFFTFIFILSFFVR